MDFSVEKRISNLIESQFPSFYQEDGPNFILFVKAYYEWMEQQGNPIGEARSLFDYRDIDNTTEAFLQHFQEKYLYGIPFDVIINKRFLLKHILDVYRSKGSLQCYKLLFRLIYNEDIEIYLPGRDIIKPSDGTWVEGRYLEITNTPNAKDLVGKTIYGASSRTIAVVESYITQPINQNIVGLMYLSNVSPKGGNFIKGEQIIDYDYKNAPNFFQLLEQSPTILGSLDNLTVINGGQGFKVGDILKIAHRDLSNNQIISYGVDGLLRVDSLSRAFGSLSFNILNGGFGVTNNSLIFLYNGTGDTTGKNASFSIGSVTYTQNISYNTDIICDYLNTTLNATAYNFPANSSANLSSTISSVLSSNSKIFGSLYSLTNIKTGNSYTQPTNIFVREVIVSNNLPGSISYTTTSNTITGSSTNFLTYFANNDTIYIQANSVLGSTGEYAVIKTVANNTSLTLYGPPSHNSTASAIFKAAPVILPSNFALYEPVMQTSDSTINGLNTVVTGYPSVGNGTIGTLVAVNSGKGYVDGEFVKAYLYAGLNTPSVITGGLNYVNGDLIVCSGGGTISQAQGFVTTNATGGVTGVTLTYSGSNYTEPPTITIRSATGNGASLTSTISEFNTFSEVTGLVNKTGTGKGKGYWSTTQGFLDSDKYIEDDYFYQDFSYQIKTALQLNKYKDILYDTFHIAGTALFGKYQLITEEIETHNIVYQSLFVDTKYSIDTTSLTIDSNTITIDTEYANSSLYVY